MLDNPVRPVTSTTVDLLPRRNPGLIQRIFGLIVRSDPGMGPQPLQQMSTQSGILPELMHQLFGQYFDTLHDRFAVYKDSEEMDLVSEEVSTALDIITNNVCTSEDGQQMSFAFQAERPEVQALLDETAKNCDLYRRVRAICRNALKYGDDFTEVVVSGEGRIVKAKQLPPSSMYRNQDRGGDLKMAAPDYDKVTNAVKNVQEECAFEQRTEDTKTIIAAFYPWQMAHTRLNWDGFSVYGRSHLRTTRIVWKKLKAMEEGMIVARLTRAFLKLVFHIDTTGLAPKEKEAAITRFKNAITQRQRMDGRREQPWWALTDIFLADGYVRTPGGQAQQSRSRVELLDPKNEQLGNIPDIKYFHRKFLVTLRVPPAHMGIEEDVNSKATLGWQDVNYIRFIRDVQQVLSQTIKQVADTALVLAGYDPKVEEYEIVWPRLSASDEAADAQAEQQRSMADETYAALGVYDPTWIRFHRFGMTQEESDELDERMAKQKEEDFATGLDQKTREADAMSEFTEEDDEKPEKPEVDQEGPDVAQAFSPAAQQASAAARVGRPHPHHGGFQGAHFHGHKHAGMKAHSHVHVHRGGQAHAKHPHGRAQMQPIGMESERERLSAPMVVRSTDLEVRAAVSLMAESLRSRVEEMTRADTQRMLDELRAAVTEAGKVVEEGDAA